MTSSHLSIQRFISGKVALSTLLLACSVFMAPQARAAVMQVSPVRVEFAPEQPAQSLQVFNVGQGDLDAQVRIMRWTQVEGKDHLVPADDVVASPAIMRVAQGQRQTVRLVRLHPAAPAQELSYRVLLYELPRKGGPQQSGVNVLLGYSIPVFVRAQAPQAVASNKLATASVATDLSGVRAQIVAGKGGSAQLRLRNDGARALRIGSLSTLTADGRSRVVDPGLLGYVLPGQQMSWPVQLPYPLPSGLTLKARFNDDTEPQTIPLERSGR